jgi:small subunit ribosomal protein S6
MHNYEVMVILDPQLDDRTVTATIDKFLLAITSNGGTVDKVDIWGRRRMTYQIQKHSEGIYVVVNVTSSPAAVSEFDRLLRIS